MDGIKQMKVCAEELEAQYKEDIGKPVGLYNRPINQADIRAATFEWKDAERRSIEKYGEPGLVAVPAGTSTPSMEWASSVRNLKYFAELYKTEKPYEVSPKEWATALAELVEISDRLNAIVDEA